MNKDITKAIELAEKEHETEKIEIIKEIVKRTLEKIDEYTKDKDELKDKEREIDEKIKILKQDIEDFKSGRLDKIKERQTIDKTAKDTSIVIIKEIVREVDRPYPVYIEPYKPWKTPYELIYMRDPNAYNFTVSDANGTSDLIQDAFCSSGELFRTFASGTYRLDNGDIKSI